MLRNHSPIGLGIVLIASAAHTVVADSLDNDTSQFGVRSSVVSDNRDEDFYQAELLYSRPLPWRWQFDGGQRLSAYLDITAGHISSAGDDGMIYSAGPSFRGNTPWQNAVFAFGISPTYITRSRYGEENLGGRFHFTSFLGLNVTLSPNADLGLRFQHMSNGGLNSTNPGLNLLSLEFRYALDQRPVLIAQTKRNLATLPSSTIDSIEQAN